MKKHKVSMSEGVQLGLCAIFTLCLVTVLHSCGPAEDGAWMHCHTAWTAVLCMAAAMLAVNALRLLDLGSAARLVFDAVTALLAVIAALTPGTIVSLCMMKTMRCQSVMRPGVVVFCVLIAVSAVVDGVTRYKASQKKEEA